MDKRFLLLLVVMVLSIQFGWADQVIHHKVDHNISIGGGKTFEELVVASKSTVVPGIALGSLEGVIQALICMVNTSNEAQKHNHFATATSDIAEGTLNMLAEQWRENPEEFQQSSGEIDSYLLEKGMHNLMKYIAGLVALELFLEKKDVTKNKQLFVERYINSLVRGRQLLHKTVSKTLWNGLLRTMTEAVYVVDHDGTTNLVINPLVGLGSFVGGACGQIVAEACAGNDTKKYTKINRWGSLVGASLLKTAAKMYGGRETTLMSLNEDRYILNTPVVAACGLSVAGLVWLAQYKHSGETVVFMRQVVDLGSAVLKLVNLWNSK